MAKQTKAYIALLYVCICWGTTYLVIRIGVMHYPPFLFAGMRQFIAGIILITGALAVNKNTDLSLRNIGRQILVGFLMLTMGNGCVTWGEQYIPSGIAALICSMMPLFAVLFNLAFFRNERFNLLIILGLILGTCGVGLIFMHDLKQLSNTSYLLGMGSVLLATCSWAAGSLINKQHQQPVNPFFNSGLQLLFGGLIMLVLSPVLDDLHHVVVWNTDGLLSLLYLIVFGSVLAYAAYMYTLTKLPVGVATIYAYINPMVAVIVGYMFMKEDLNIYTGLAFITIVISVYLVNRGYRQQHRQTTTNTISNIRTVEDTIEGTLFSNVIDAFPENAPVES